MIYATMEKKFDMMEHRKKVIEEQRIIIKYLENRVAELNVLVSYLREATRDE